MRRRSHCPICYGLDIFGDKWSLLIMRDLMFNGKQTYGDFLQSDEKIATNILANRLSILQTAGLIKAKKDKEKKTRIIYSLTEKGIDLLPVMLELKRWSAAYDKHTIAEKKEITRIKNGRDGLVKEIAKELKKRDLQS